jgi:hypothetical protein
LRNSKKQLGDTKRNLEDQTQKLESAVTKAEDATLQAHGELEKAKLDVSNAEAGLNAVKSVNAATATVEHSAPESSGDLSTASQAATKLQKLPAEFFDKRTQGTWTAIGQQCLLVTALLQSIPEARDKAASLSTRRI